MTSFLALMQQPYWSLNADSVAFLLLQAVPEHQPIAAKRLECHGLGGAVCYGFM
jgi:hypothetical protein